MRKPQYQRSQLVKGTAMFKRWKDIGSVTDMLQFLNNTDTTIHKNISEAITSTGNILPQFILEMDDDPPSTAYFHKHPSSGHGDQHQWAELYWTSGLIQRWSSLPSDLDDESQPVPPSSKTEHLFIGNSSFNMTDLTCLDNNWLHDMLLYYHYHS